MLLLSRAGVAVLHSHWFATLAPLARVLTGDLLRVLLCWFAGQGGGRLFCAAGPPPAHRLALPRRGLQQRVRALAVSFATLALGNGSSSIQNSNKSDYPSSYGSDVSGCENAHVNVFFEAVLPPIPPINVEIAHNIMPSKVGYFILRR